jgi:hypothetical protein
MFELNTKSFLVGSHNIFDLFRTLKFKRDFKKAHSDYFEPEGLLVFCGCQGSGKTLSAVNYISQLSYEYPKCIIVTNTDLTSINPNSRVIEYEGINSLTDIENGEFGVLYFIDEIHLEFNSLESKNIGAEVFVEIAQQRKQRKHIVGTSQVYGRLAKPFREQIRWVVACKNLLGCIQLNVLIDGNTATEKDGQLVYESSKPFIWFHSPKLYQGYDTYAKMKRYRKEWNK